MVNIANKRSHCWTFFIFLSAAASSSVSAFLFQNGASYVAKSLRISSESVDETEPLSVIGVVAPLISVGPYACLALNFPNVTSKPMMELLFVLDTAANVNTISSKIATELDLPVVIKGEDLSILGSVGAGGSFQAGDIVMLGESRLCGMPANQQNNTFISNMSLASMDLGIAGSVGSGVLGISFFDCFRGGVEFDWYGTDGDPPTLQFYYDSLPEEAKLNCACVPLNTTDFFGVPTVSVKINGRELRAIIDTGSPITIISPSIAVELGLSKKEGTVKIKGIDDGDAMGVSKSLDEITLSIGDVDINLATIFIGELPGLAMASNLVPEHLHPQVLIGLDALRRTYRMIIRLSKAELWLESLPTQDCK
eukprot:scaffold4530_cov146-Skeletonema_menzelii.AAC.16